MKTSKLVDIVASLASFDPAHTIYAAEPWTCDSDAIVAREPDEGGLPPEAESHRAVYFIEVFIAKEFLDGWVASEARPPSAQRQCDRLIQYAVSDA